jgi:hypothetical protein
VLHLIDKAKILGLLKGNMSLADVGWWYGKVNQASMVQD